MRWYELSELSKNLDSMSDDEARSSLHSLGVKTVAAAKQLLAGLPSLDRIIGILEGSKRVSKKDILVPNTDMTLQEALKWLEEKSWDYYNSGMSEATDEEFDFIYRQVKTMVPDHPFFTKKIRADVAGGNKAVLRNPVYSLKKIDLALDQSGKLQIIETFASLKKWMQEFGSMTGDPATFVCSPKFDGLTLVLYYEKGRLMQALTGGDGREGKDVTVHALVIAGIPNMLKEPLTCEVRGEVVIRNSRFVQLQEQQQDEKTSFANPRNLAAGTLGLKDSVRVAERKLDFCAWNLLIGGKEFSMKEEDKFSRLEQLGFAPLGTNAVLRRVTSDDVDSIMNYYQYLDSVRQSTPVSGKPLVEDVAMDGIVVTLNDPEMQKSLGFSEVAPNFAIAVKFAGRVLETRVKDIEWQVSRNGRVVPTLVLDPVQLDGSTINRATGDNYRRVVTEGIGIGSRVLLQKAGMTIPRVMQVLEKAPNFVLPEACPICGTRLATSGVDLVCRGYYCPGQIIGRIVHFFKTVATDKFGVSEQFLKTLFDSGLVQDVSDLYAIKEATLMALPGIGEVRAKAFMAFLDESRQMSLSTLLRGLSIPGVGGIWADQIAIMLADDGSRLLSPIAMTYEMVMDLLKGKEKGKKLPINVLKNFCTWFSVDANAKMIQKMMEHGVEILCEKAGDVAASEGKRFCVTGKTSIPRNELVKLLQKHGYVFTPTVTKKTNYLVCNVKSESSKSRKAQSYGTKVLTEEEMLAQISGLVQEKEGQGAIAEKRAEKVDKGVAWDRAVKLVGKEKDEPETQEPNLDPPMKPYEEPDFFD